MSNIVFISHSVDGPGFQANDVAITIFILAIMHSKYLSNDVENINYAIIPTSEFTILGVFHST